VLPASSMESVGQTGNWIEREVEVCLLEQAKLSTNVIAKMGKMKILL